jgi:hypothetical protein
VDEFYNERFDTEEFDTDEFDLSPGLLRNRAAIVGVGMPLVILLVVIGVVSGLVFAGVIQGHESRVGPEQAPTTRSTVLIVP